LNNFNCDHVNVGFVGLIKILFLQESGDYVEKEERVVGCGK
jgi:hypothetical protein